MRRPEPLRGRTKALLRRWPEAATRRGLTVGHRGLLLLWGRPSEPLRLLRRRLLRRWPPEVRRRLER